MHITLIPDTLFHIGSMPITSSLLMSWIVVASVLFFIFVLRSKLKTVPKGLQNLSEIIVEFFIDTITGVFGDRKLALKWFPFLFTIFVFVLFSNWIGILPGVGSVLFHTEHGEVPFLRSATADLNTTFALATISIMAIEIAGIYALGFFRYFKRFLNLKSPMEFFIGLIELISEFSKFIAFSFRLFGNIFGGKVVLTIIIFLVPVLLPIPFYGFEVFVGLLQAFILSLLTAVFIKIATTDLTAEH